MRTSNIFITILSILIVLTSITRPKAELIYQSIPNFNTTTSPFAYYCSPCDGDSQSIGQRFSVTRPSVAKNITFVVVSAVDIGYNWAWPVPITLGIYQDNNGVVGNVIYYNTFSEFEEDIPTLYNTDIVTVDLGNGIPLTGGSYLLFLTDRYVTLGIAGYFGIGNGGWVGISDSTYPILTGDIYYSLNPSDVGVSISGTASSVIEPSTWLMMVVAFICLTFMRMRMHRRPIPLKVRTAAVA